MLDKAVSYINKHSKEEKPFFLYLPLSAPHTPILPNSEFLGKSKTNIYGDFVMQVDDVLNQIRRALKHNKLTNNTLLVFASDNGCSPRAGAQAQYYHRNISSKSSFTSLISFYPLYKLIGTIIIC